MNLFKKKGPEIIDLIELNKKGTLQRSRAIAQKRNAFSANEDKVIDLTSPSSSQSSSISTSSSDSPFSLLSSLAGAASDSPAYSSTSSSLSSSDFQSIKIKIEDIEYKLDRFIERLAKLEEKLSASS